MYRKTSIVIERDGLVLCALTITFDLRSQDFDWRAAVKAVCEECVQSEAGRRIYRYDCGNFNWANFAQYVHQARLPLL